VSFLFQLFETEAARARLGRPVSNQIPPEQLQPLFSTTSTLLGVEASILGFQEAFSNQLSSSKESQAWESCICYCLSCAQ
jgi:hypothetical protein